MSVKQVLKEVLFGEKPPTTSATTTTAPLAQPLSQPAVVQTPLVQTQTLSASTVNPPQVDVEVVRRAPVVREVIHPLEKHEVNPVIYREREQTEVRQVEQPIYEKVQKPVVIREAALPSETRPVQQLQTGDFDLKYQELNQQYQPSVSYAPVERETVTRPPVVIETIRKHVKEEIQPVIYREILQQEIVRETKPIHERIIEAPTLIKLQASPLYETRNLQESLPSVVAPVGGTTGVGLTGTPLGGVSYGGDLSSSSSNIPISGPSTYGVGFNQMGTTTNLPMSYGTTSNIPISGTSYGTTTSNLPMSGASYGTTSNIPISSGSMGTSAIPSTNIPISGPSSVVGSAIRDVKNVVNEGLQRSGSSSHWNTSTS